MSDLSSGWRVRPMRAGDEAGIRRLLERGFGRRLEQADWRWKFKLRPSPVENVWLAADGDGQPIFHYGGVPRTLKLGAEERDVMIAVDSVTESEFRRRGILTAGVRSAHRAWAEAGFACVLGLPNEQWGSRIQALDWRPLFPLTWLLRPLRPEQLLARRLGFPPLGKLGFIGRLGRSLPQDPPDPSFEIEEVERLGDEVGAVAAAYASEGLLLPARDSAWLDWRYFACPLHRYRMLAARRGGRLAGYLVYRFDPESRYGFIAELLTRPDDDGARYALAVAAAERLDRRGAIAVAALAAPGSALFRSLRHARFLPRRKSFGVHCVPLADDFDPAMLRDPSRFWLQGGDFDVI
jgi:hypothetical protein